MKKGFLLILAVLGFCSCAKYVDDESEPTFATPGNIYGVVTVKETAEPMRATGVALYHLGSLLLKTVTYDDGHYEFENLSPGDYILTVVASGYANVSYKVTVEAGRTARADMQLEKANTYMTVRTLDIIVVGNKVSIKGEYTGRQAGRNTTTKADEAGFLYATQQENITNGTRVTASFEEHNSFGSDSRGYYGKGTFKTDINNLSVGTYYVVAYTKNDYGTEFGEVKTFEIDGAPVVRTLAVTNMSTNSATLNGIVEYSGSPAYSERGFVYSSSFPNPTIDDPDSATKKVSVPGSSSEFSANIAGLAAQTYYVRAYITNSEATSYGESIEFTIGDYIKLSNDGMMVHRADISAGASFDDAQSLCETSDVGGFSDWRVPTIGECDALYSHKTALSLEDDWYWTSESHNINYNTRYYTYNFTNGSDSYEYVKYPTYRVRCVRTLK